MASSAFVSVSSMCMSKSLDGENSLLFRSKWGAAHALIGLDVWRLQSNDNFVFSHLQLLIKESFVEKKVCEKKLIFKQVLQMKAAQYW